MRRFILLSLVITFFAASAHAQTPPAAPVLLGPNDTSPFSSGSFPAGSSDTGVTGCPALTPSAGFTAGTDGATYQNLDVSGQIIVNASNVTFRCVRLRAPGYRYGFQISGTANGTLLESVDVANASDSASGSTGQGKCILIYGTNTTIRRADVSDCEDGIHISSSGPTLVEWSYIHNMKTVGTNLHSDAVQIVSGGNVTLRNNRIVPQITAGAGVNSALTLESYSSALQNLEIASNQLAGGNFVLYIFPDTYNGTLQPCPSGVKIHDNQWLKGIYQYGYRFYRDTAPFCTPSLNGGSWTNNLLSDGTVLPEVDGGTTTTSPPPSTAVASLSTSPTSLSVSTVAGTNPANGAIGIKNSGGSGSTLSWSVTESVPWLSVTPASGTATTETDTVTVAYNSASLAAGTYSGTITVSDGSSQQQSVPVSLTVAASTSSGGTSGGSTGSTSGKQFPDGATDTGLNAPLPSLGGKTCMQYCGGNFPAYVGSDTPAAGAVIECKTWNQGFKLTKDNITIRCNDISAPGDLNGIIKVPSGATANNFLIEGNKIHNAHTSSTCAAAAFTIYKGWGTIQYNDVSDISDTYVQPGNDAFSTPVVFQWNWEHDTVNSATCAGSHDESIHCETGNCPRTYHNRLEHSTAAQSWAGTATYRSESNPGVVLSEDVQWNLFQGGGYQVTADGHGAVFKNNTFVTGAWHFGAFSFATPPTTFSGNVCTNGHTLTLADGGANACNH